MITRSGQCIVLERLYEACWWDMQIKGNGLQTMWAPIDNDEGAAIPEHKAWYKIFKNHISHCSVCISLKAKDNKNLFTNFKEGELPCKCWYEPENEIFSYSNFCHDPIHKIFKYNCGVITETY